MQGLNITQQKTLLRASPFKFSIKHFMGYYFIWLTNQKESWYYTLKKKY